jgi:hypothetical protein
MQSYWQNTFSHTGTSGHVGRTRAVTLAKVQSYWQNTSGHTGTSAVILAEHVQSCWHNNYSHICTIRIGIWWNNYNYSGTRKVIVTVEFHFVNDPENIHTATWEINCIKRITSVYRSHWQFFFPTNGLVQMSVRLDEFDFIDKGEGLLLPIKRAILRQYSVQIHSIQSI